jgi:hypothetical protein
VFYRVIVRMSLNGDDGSKVRNALAARLNKGKHFRNTATGTWESKRCVLAKAMKILSKVLLDLSGLSDPTIAHLDHIWIYIDRVRGSSVSSS